jgi:hypothetical protein
MPNFTLSKVKGPKVNFMEKQTRSAVLLHLMEHGNQTAYWFPKSQLELRPIEVRGEKMFEVYISQWAWSRREPAKGMGCL